MLQLRFVLEPRVLSAVSAVTGVVLVQVAQTVMSDLLSNPHHPGVNPNIILDNFLMDLRQSLITR